MSFYTIDSVTFSYTKADILFKNISLNIKENQQIGLLGPNGCGKTTLAKLMLGILKPKKGEIYLEGKNIQSIPLSDIGKKVGFLFQNPDKQLFCPTVREQMNFSLKSRREIIKPQAEKRIKHYLETFDLCKNLNTPPFKLSRGEKQRLALATILLRDVKFLILDEPTTGLDMLRIEQLGKYLISLKNEGKGYIIISHDVNFLKKHVDKLLVLGQKGVEFLDKA